MLSRGEVGGGGGGGRGNYFFARQPLELFWLSKSQNAENINRAKNRAEIDQIEENQTFLRSKVFHQNRAPFL